MKLWAVSHISWSDNNLRTEFHLADTWKEALRKHSAHANPEYKADYNEWFAGMPDDIEKAKKYAFDSDIMIEVVPVPVSAGTVGYDSLKEGMFLLPNETVGCLPPIPHEVRRDNRGFFVQCAEGNHYLDGQRADYLGGDKDDTLVNFVLVHNRA